MKAEGVVPLSLLIDLARTEDEKSAMESVLGRYPDAVVVSHMHAPEMPLST